MGTSPDTPRALFSLLCFFTGCGFACGPQSSGLSVQCPHAGSSQVVVCNLFVTFVAPLPMVKNGVQGTLPAIPMDPLKLDPLVHSWPENELSMSWGSSILVGIRPDSEWCVCGLEPALCLAAAPTGHCGSRSWHCS